MGKFVNPFEPENFISGGGGGLWDGKVVTILSAKTKINPMVRGDGTPVLDESGQPINKNVLEIVGIADEDENERRETYGAGSLRPTADGEGFLTPNGEPGVRFHKSSEISLFSQALRDSGFPVANLWDSETGYLHVSVLNGARFLFRADVRKDANGQPKKNQKGYDLNRFLPAKFEGYKGGSAPVTTTQPDALRDKAVAAVVSVLTSGPATRAELVRKLSVALAGDPDTNKIIALVAREDFHTNVPWTKTPTGYSL